MTDFQKFINSIKFDSESESLKKFKQEFLNMENDDSYRPIHFASRYDKVEIIEFLIKQNCDFEASEKSGMKPIHLACECGHFNAVKVLLNHCDHEAMDNDNRQSIHFACLAGYINVVNLLIKRECNIEACTKGGMRPIHFACLSKNVDVVNKLIALGCDFKATTNNGMQPIHYACLSGSIEIVKTLILHKCELDVREKNGKQPIHFVILSDFLDIVKLLISKGCDLEACTPKNWRPIHFACRCGNVEIINELIRANCDKEAATEDGWRPIHFACAFGYVDVVRILISQNCEIYSQTKKKKFAIDLAKDNNFTEIINILNKLTMDWIATSMNLTCNDDCKHEFCRKSLESEEFTKGTLVGRGSGGEVYKFKNVQTNRNFVVKCINLQIEDKSDIENSINKFGPIIKHKNIVQYYGALEKSDKVCIYMEYAPNGSLKKKIKKSGKFPLPEIIENSKQLLEGLEFLHSKGIVHRDVKPENILIGDGGILKLSDFGVSKKVATIGNTLEETKTFCGTPNYMAPEVFLGKDYTYSVDIWSTGATVIEMLTGVIPFGKMRPEAVMFQIGSLKKLDYKLDEPISATMQSFIDELLKPNYKERQSAQMLLKHKFLNH